MISIRNFIHRGLLFCCLFSLMFFSCSFKLLAEEIEWLEVSRTNNELLSINPDSLKYNNNGFLSVLAKYYELDPVDQNVISNNSFLMAIDCENRLFSKFPVKADLKKIKRWDNPVHNKLIKRAIINSCSY